jgi:hypothetical protein
MGPNIWGVEGMRLGQDDGITILSRLQYYSSYPGYMCAVDLAYWATSLPLEYLREADIIQKITALQNGENMKIERMGYVVE